jgi:DNA-binding NarL/FixJ family response regulator
MLRDATPPHRPHVLSPREACVLDGASRGLTNHQVARELGVTVHAVKFHLASVYRKLGVTNRTEATRVYLTGRADQTGE